jgi:hypothetical protein
MRLKCKAGQVLCSASVTPTIQDRCDEPESQKDVCGPPCHPLVKGNKGDEGSYAHQKRGVTRHARQYDTASAHQDRLCSSRAVLLAVVSLG